MEGLILKYQREGILTERIFISNLYSATACLEFTKPRYFEAFMKMLSLVGIYS
jgi:hypothetical protein